MSKQKLQLLLEDYMTTTSSYRTTPIRSPFSNQQYYQSGQASAARWLDLTDLYNATYRTFYREDGFEKVKYNEPLNILIMWPTDDAEAFERIDYDPVITFGLKTARGFGKDYRFLDHSIPGAGKVAVSRSMAEKFMTEPYEHIADVRPEYMRNLGQFPIEKHDEDPDQFATTADTSGDTLEESKNILREYEETDPVYLARAYYFGDVELDQIEDEVKRKKVQQIASDFTEDGLTTHELEPTAGLGTYLQKVIRDELSSMEHREQLTELNMREIDGIKKAVRQYQLNEEPVVAVDALLENALDSIESEKALVVGENEAQALHEALKGNDELNHIRKKL